jgi:transcriptional regulator with XRE-family HTH domain
MIYEMTIGERLRELRKEKRKTLRDINDGLGISYSNLAQIERGEHGCNAETLNILAQYFNVSMDYILGKTDNPKATIIQVADSDGSITSIEYELLDKVKGFTTDDMQKVFEYVDFIKSKSEVKK